MLPNVANGACQSNLAADDSSPVDTDLQHHLVQVCENGLAEAALYLPEVELFMHQLNAKTKLPTLSGLPALYHALNKNQTVLKRAARAASELSGTRLPEETLKQMFRNVDASTVSLSHGAVQWDILKRCRSFVAVNQAFQGSARESRLKQMAHLENLNPRQKQTLHRTLKEQAKVEVTVVEGGAEWVDIRPVQVDRLARQMTESGWGWGEHELGDVVDRQEWEDIPLARQVERLMAATKLNRHEYSFPRVRVILTNIGGESEDINILLDNLARLDPSVEVTIEHRDTEFLQRKAPDIGEAIQNLIRNGLEGLTETLNLDHTILIDLISDLTHFRLEPQPWQEATTRAQIEEEARHGGQMVRALYPLLKGRTLVCTREAAEHFHTLLETVGTAAERERGKLLVPENATPAGAVTCGEARQRFQQLSIHPLPSAVQVPVTVIDEDWSTRGVELAVADNNLPSLALDVARQSGFRTSKLSIFMYGWASGHVTITSNKEIRANIKTMVEANRRSDDDRGPAIWRLDITRNLLAASATPPDGYKQFHDPASTTITT